MKNMSKEKIECIRQIAETAGLLSQQLSNFANLLENEITQSTESSIETKLVQEVSPNNSVPTKDDHTKYETAYFGAPSGSGFEESSQLQSTSVKCLYVIQKTSETNALFYPIPEKLSRFKMNPNPLFHIVCDSVGDILNANSLEFTEEDYGTLEYENGYWKVTKKCTVFCN